MDETLTLRKEKKITFWKLKIKLDDEMMEMTTMKMELKQKEMKPHQIYLNLRYLIDLTIIHHDFALAYI
ncbi:hypothetical protein KY284_036397 [Solanum tuberosum]|nr:hypothetical protein KY284_036397 [Solanum tuberosum]